MIRICKNFYSVHISSLYGHFNFSTINAIFLLLILLFSQWLSLIGDQFAMMEATATLALIVQRFDLDLAMDPKDVGMRTGE